MMCIDGHMGCNNSSDAQGRHRPVVILSLVALRWWAGARQKPEVLRDLADSMLKDIKHKEGTTNTRSAFSKILP